MFIVKASKYPIGIDISDTSIKAVQLNRRGEKITIQALAKSEIPEGVVVNGDIKDRESLIKNLSGLLLKPKYGVFSSRDIVAGLPDSRTYIKVIEIEDNPNELKNLVANEIENHIPLPLNELCYDFQIIRKKHGLNRILIGGAGMAFVNQYVDLFKGTKLNVSALETESIANARALLEEESPKPKNENQNNYALINIGAKRAGLSVYAEKTIVFSVSMPISGFEVTQKIAKALEITLEQAEKAKIICGLDDTKAQGIISEILSDNIKKLNAKILESINFYNKNHEDYGSLTKIILCGGGANIKNLDLKISKSCGIDTEIGNIELKLKGIQKFSEKIFTETHNLATKLIDHGNDKNISGKQNSSLSFATAIGLALRGIYLE